MTLNVNVSAVHIHVHVHNEDTKAIIDKLKVLGIQIDTDAAALGDAVEAAKEET